MSAFDNMPEVPKGKYKTQPQGEKKSGISPLVLGAAGCLVLLLCLALAGAIWFMTLGPGKAATTALTGNNTPSASTSSGTPSTSSGTPSASGTPGSSSVNALANVKIAYSVDTGATPGDKNIWIMNADGSGAKKLITNASSPAFSPDGSMIAYYHWTDGIYVANADGSNARKVLGESNAKYLAWSHDGQWIAFSSKPNPNNNRVTNTNLDAVMVDGSKRRSVVLGGSMPSWSPDDQRVVFSDCRGSDCGIIVAGSGGGDQGQLIAKGEGGTNPAWSPDGNKIVYQGEVDGVKQLFVVNADGSGKKQLTTGQSPHVGAQWSPDGSVIFYRAAEGDAWSIWKINADGSNPVKLIGNVTPVDWAFERLAVTK